MIALCLPSSAPAVAVREFLSEIELPVVVAYRHDGEFFEVDHVRFLDPLPCIQGKLAWFNLPARVMNRLEDEARHACDQQAKEEPERGAYGFEGLLQTEISLPVKVRYQAETREIIGVSFVGLGGLVGRFLWEQMPEREESILREEVEKHSAEAAE